MDGGLDAEGGSLRSFELPDYLVDTYRWAYLTPASLVLLDNPIAMTMILWGNLPRLVRAACDEFTAGQHVLQTASVYGPLSRELATTLGPDGLLDVIDIAPLQVAHCRQKLAEFPQTRVRMGDATRLEGAVFDAACCFFLLHEIPDEEKRAVVDGLLARVPVGGKVVFVDYHRSAGWHPLRPVMNVVFRWLEPFAFGLIDGEITALASTPEEFDWRKETYFGGLYQKVVAVRKGDSKPR